MTDHQDKSETTASSSKSALQDNIERKGKNAYYFAHAHKVNGPQWDGKAEPKLMARHTSHEGHRAATNATFDYHKSNITSYAFLDDGTKVKLYLEMEGIGDKLKDDDVSLEYTETSLCVIVNNYKPTPQCLSFSKLSGDITNATFRIKKDKLILTLTKKNEGEWHTINDKGAPDHEVV